ncbi:hypothetical protein NDU88_004493 [Pleurodeles waltl]|uniref:Uncharacterized protein n=1 Tax=Pleurodeles waltl TaxID=8319 RepID=A0AAV7V5D8_PLEWA|nr:hypothetical protein NDU88_004493 [Pleurodeles waltl]
MEGIPRRIPFPTAVLPTLLSPCVAGDAESHGLMGQGPEVFPVHPPLHHSLPSLFPHLRRVGSRICHYLSKSITTDMWVLRIILRGYYLPFETALPAMLPSYGHLPEDHLARLHEEVAVLLAKGAIERVPAPEVGCGSYYCYFLVPKKDKGLRAIPDRWALQLFLKKEKFKMLTLAQVLCLGPRRLDGSV